MKKYFFSIISVLILAVLTSCSGLTDSYSQVSVEFPEGTSNQLTLLRAADNTSSNITCLLKTTGDYEATATATYSSAEELNNKQITISGIPVNKTIAVKLQLLVDNQLLYEGISEKITVQKGDNLVNMKIKPAKVEVSFETAEFGIAAFDKNGKNTGNKLMYSEEDVYRIAPTLNGELFIPENAEVEWRINGLLASDLAYEDQNGSVTLFVTTEEPYLSFSNQSLEIFDYKLFVQYIIVGDDYIEVADGNFTIEYPTPTVSTNISTDFALTYLEGNNHYLAAGSSVSTLEDKEFQCTSSSAYALAADGGYYFTEVQSDKTTSIKKSNNSDFEIPDVSVTYLYSDLEKGYISYYDKYNSPYNVTTANLNNTEEKITHVISDRADVIATSGAQEYVAYAYRGEDNKPLIGLYSKATNVTSGITVDKYYDCYGTTITDMYFLNNYLFVLVSSNTKNDDPSNTYEEGNYTKGVLIVINVNNPRIVKVYGESKESYTIKIYNGTRDYEEEMVKVFGNSKSDATAFFGPQKIVAIKEDEIYIADGGWLFCDAEEPSAGKNKGRYKNINRIVSVNLSDFSLKTVADIPFTLEGSFCGYDAITD